MVNQFHQKIMSKISLGMDMAKRCMFRGEPYVLEVCSILHLYYIYSILFYSVLFFIHTVKSSKQHLDQDRLFLVILIFIIITDIISFFLPPLRGHHGRDRMVVGFTITYAISTFHH